MSYLTCQDLAVGYASEVVARHITFEVNSGDLVCILGENGTGKSTLVKTILGLRDPYAGELSFSDGATKHTVGYLPQQGETQRDFPASVEEIVLSGCLSHLGKRHFFRNPERELAAEQMRRVHVDDLAKRPFSRLSGGQQQRVLIARALCAATKLLVLDEPTTGLDPKSAAMLYETIDDLRAEGMGVISVSHDVQQATEHASHVLVVGERPFFGTTAEWRETFMGVA